MASFSAFLEVKGNRFPLLSYDLSIHQETDSLGRPASPVLGGTIDCVLSAPGSDKPFLTQWMLSPTMQEDGRIVLMQVSPEATLKAINFFSAYCTGLQTHFVPGAGGGGSLQMNLRISPQRIAVGAIVHDNNWPLESHGAGETFAKATPPAPKVPPKKEEEPSAFMEGLHGVLDVVGMIPVIGEVADAANAALYLSEGRYGEAAMAAAAMIPLAGNVVGAAKLAKRAAKLIGKVRDLKAVQKLRKLIPKKLVKKLDDVDFAGIGGCDGRGHPVDVATGLMYTTSVDFSLPGSIPLVWERNWYSASDHRGPLGHGWHHAYDLGLALDTTTNVAVLRMADGRQVAFDPPQQPGQAVLDLETKLALYRPLPSDPALSPWLILDKNQQRFYTFAPPVGGGSYQPLNSVENEQGQFIGFQYTPDLRLQRITDSAGRQITVAYNQAGQIRAMTLVGATATAEPITLVGYEYDVEGNLTGATNAEGHTTTFRYDQHRMVQETNPLGHSFYFEYETEGAGGKPPRCVHTWGDGGVFDTRLTYLDEQTTEVTDSYGQPDRYTHRRGRVTGKTNALGHDEVRYYDESQQLVATTDELGRTTRYRYDEAGNLVSTQFANGTYQQTDYDADDRPVSFTNGRGNTWHYRYDEDGRLSTETDPLGVEIRYSYDEQDRLTTLTNALSQTTHLRYDSQGNLAHIVTPDEQIRSRGYDEMGNLTTLTDPTGAIEKRAYNRIGQLTQVIEADGRSRNLTYDSLGNLVHLEQGDQIVTMSYNGQNRLTVRQQADQQIQFEYDLEGRLTALTNEAGLRYRYGLNEVGQVIKEEGFDGVLRHYERDAAGQVTQVLRPAGRYTKYSYTPIGQLATVEYSDGGQEVFDYDEAGVLSKAKNNTSTIRFERDALGRIVREEQGEHWVDYDYDAQSQRTRIISSMGADIALTRDSTGKLAQMQSQGWQAQFAYNKQGLEIQRQLSGNVAASSQRDESGRLTQQQIDRGTEQRTRVYNWHTATLLEQIDDSLSGNSQYRYDAAGTLVYASYGDGSEEIRSPDIIGNLFEQADRMDRQYGPGGQLLVSKHGRYEYDTEGNLTRKTTSSGNVWLYEWSHNGELAAVTRPDSSVVSFTYDALGRRIKKECQGKTTHWLWDANKPLHEWRTLTLDGQNTDEVITWLFEEDSFAPVGRLQGTAYQNILTDHLGTPFEMVDQDGKRTWSAQTTAYGRLRVEEGAREECPFRFQGQYEDVETGLYYNRFRYYAPQEGLYISQDPIGLLGGGRLYGYVADPLSWLDVLGLMPFWKPLKPTGMGHHPIPRSHANQHGLPKLGTEYDSPSWYPDKVDGSDDLHKRLHQVVKDAGVPFNRPFTGTQQELIDKIKQGYQGIDEKGFLKIPSTGEIIAKDITIGEAVDKQINWNAAQSVCPGS